MYQIDFKHPAAKLYFCGVGGSSMSGLAGMMKQIGFDVWGSDIAKSPALIQAEKDGVHVIIGQKAENITKDIDCVIFTAAIAKTNPEYQAVLNLGIPHLTRAELLGQIMAQFPMSIGIAGTHGKTTTTSFISEILLRDGKDPSMQIGGVLNSVHTSYRLGKSDEFVAEACEYTNSFLSLKPRIGIITNIEADHLDFFKDLADVRHSFRLFAENIPADGWLIINTEIPDLDEITNGLKCKVIYFGDNHEKADYYATDIKYNELAEASYTLVRRHGQSQKIVLEVPGKQFIWDSLAAAAACDLCGVKPESITDALRAYKGAGRRFQFKGKINGCQIVDDYAHHPDELRASIASVRDLYPGRRLTVIFQPHLYTRTRDFAPGFAQALSLADEVILLPIYPAREQPIPGVTSEMILNQVSSTKKCIYSKENLIRSIELSNFDVLLTAGAGDIANLLPQICVEFKKQKQ